MPRGVNNSNRLTKDYILSKVSQISIFSAYFNLSDTLIKDCIENGTMITSPLRIDFNPTCGFRYDNRGKLKFRDFAGYFWGDCFDAVAVVISKIYKRQIKVQDKSDFNFILYHIAITFSNIFYGKEVDVNLTKDIDTAIEEIKSTKPTIELVVRDWNDRDIKYWSKYGINVHTLNINFVYPVEQYYIDRNINPNPKYYYKHDDPCYGYMLGVDSKGKHSIKLYFPKRKRNFRFITNCNHLEGIYNLNKNNYDIIIITKSTKDRICLDSCITNLPSSYGLLGVINIPHESYKLKQREYDWIKSKLNNDGFILSLMDNDIVGVKEAKWLKEYYDIDPIIIPRGLKAKDFSDLYKIDSNLIKEYIDETYRFIIDRRKERSINSEERLRYKTWGSTDVFF